MLLKTFFTRFTSGGHLVQRSKTRFSNLLQGHRRNISTVNPHYTDTRYNDKIRYTDNLTSMETLSQKVAVN